MSITTKMEKIQRLKNAFNTLRSEGVIRTQKEFAMLIGANESSISRAMKEDERYLTDNLVEQAEAAVKKHTNAPDPDAVAKAIPILPVEAIAGTMLEFFQSVKDYDCERMISPIKGVDYAIKIYGDSMSPEYPSGSLCLIKRIDEKQFVAWNEVYVLDTDNGAVIKKIRKTDKEGVVECVSINPAYQPFTIETIYIHGWYRVLMVMSVK